MNLFSGMEVHPSSSLKVHPIPEHTSWQVCSSMYYYICTGTHHIQACTSMYELVALQK